MIPYPVPHSLPIPESREDHVYAACRPRGGFERAMAYMLSGMAEYATEYQERYESPIGDDGVLGDHWRDIARGLLGLLDGELGRLDASSCESFVNDLSKEHGVDLT